MSGVDDILDLIDAGLGSAAGWAAPIKASGCARSGCKAAPVDGHDFCGPCLSWLRGDSDEPSGLPDVDAPNPEPVDEVTAWVQLYGGYCGG